MSRTNKLFVSLMFVIALLFMAQSVSFAELSRRTQLIGNNTTAQFINKVTLRVADVEKNKSPQPSKPKFDTKAPDESINLPLIWLKIKKFFDELKIDAVPAPYQYNLTAPKK